ncbi:hypothetical protein [Parasedimentitalea huanghaiensis]|uniref:Uncharacterized protein n=1 Tax=Parasedimentitalea huanghaiensis TaxID=2682100 RepID=A0A6L6WIQ2_9RHOB|nr:hypothetical protein [Zongyanglinia huanghaiensis]MVO17604.1 hypothetical protein [Zongyanglinia huanghaiensis]
MPMWTGAASRNMARVPTEKRNSEDGKSYRSIEQGSRLWQFAEAISRATVVFGDQEAAEKCMIVCALGLRNYRPIDLFATSP